MLSGTFDVSLVSDGLQRRAAGQELLQLVPSLLVVRAVHAGGGLHACEGEVGQDNVVNYSSELNARHDDTEVLRE